jgi:hypothetical protein
MEEGGAWPWSGVAWPCLLAARLLGFVRCSISRLIACFYFVAPRCHAQGVVVSGNRTVSPEVGSLAVSGPALILAWSWRQRALNEMTQGRSAHVMLMLPNWPCFSCPCRQAAQPLH